MAFNRAINDGILHSGVIAQDRAPKQRLNRQVNARHNLSTGQNPLLVQTVNKRDRTHQNQVRRAVIRGSTAKP